MTTLMTEEKQTIETEIQPILVKANQITVKNEMQKSNAVILVKTMSELKDRIEDRFHPTKNKETAYKAYQDALDTEKAFYSQLDVSIKQVKQIVKNYETEVAIAQQREAQRLEAERLDRERKEREKLEAKAVKLEESGKKAKAEMIREQAQNVQVLPEFAPPQMPTKKLIWKARCTNLFLLCKAIASGQVPFSVVEVRLSALNDFAKNYDGKTKVDGLEFYQEVASRI